MLKKDFRENMQRRKQLIKKRSFLNEMILQRGTQFRVAKIEENPHGGFFIDLEVVGSNMQKV